MKTVADTKQKTADLAVLRLKKAEVESLTVLEQMYGYFSFDPMPMEAETRLAA